MSKKHRIPPRPQLPGKMEHYSRITSEDTTDGLSAILAESVRIARRAYNKHQIGSIDLIDSAYGKRRREAIRNTFSAIRNHLCFTEKTKGQVTASEIWSNLNQYTHHPIEQLDEDDYLLLAASIWLLDHIEDTHALKNLLSSVTWEEDWGIPYVFDLRFDVEIIQATLYILHNRTDSDRYILDVNPKRGATADAFDALIALINPAYLRCAIAHTRALFWHYVDKFFDVECGIADQYSKAVDAYDKLVDRFNGGVDRITAALDKRFGIDMPKPNNVLAKPVDPLSIMKDLPRRLEPLGNSLFPLDAPPLAGSLSTYGEVLQLGDNQDRLSERIDDKAEEITHIHGQMVSFCFDYAKAGFTEPDNYRTEGAPPITAQTISNPYEICAGILLLCSPDAFRALYADISGATPEKDLDLPWLLGAMEGLCTDVAHHLPWGVFHYDEDEVPYEPNKKGLIHPDWYTLSYQEEDEPRRNLAHLVYEATGTILPRDMTGFDELKAHLGRNGLRGKIVPFLTELMTILETAQFREEMPFSSIPEIPQEDTEDVEALKGQLKSLQDRLKKATDAAHAQDQRARKAEATLAAEREKAEADRRELAGLREVVFTADHRDDDSGVSVSLPYEVRNRIVVFGGHDMWQKPMKEFLTGDIRFIDRDMAAFDTDVIRYAEVVWIQTNAISHKMYYKIMDAARKWNIPVKYFLYASARKCAEQVVLSERD